MIEDPLFYALAIPAVIMLGLAKGGFAGAGAMGLPLMALAISPVQAAAILLPILIAQDVVGVWAFRKNWDKRVLTIMLPGAFIGIFLGYLFAAKVQPLVILGALGVITIVFALYRLWLEHGGGEKLAKAQSHSPQVDAGLGFLTGIASGFTSQVAHAGQPPFQIWVLPKKLARDTLIGTTAIFFAIVNLVKVPAYFALHQFTRANLLTSAALLPLAIASTFAGVWLVRRIEPQRFYTLIYILMVIVGAGLLWEAFGR